MDENIKTTEDKSWEYAEGVRHQPRLRPEEDFAEVKRHLDGNSDLAWEEYSQEAPSVDEFNSPNYGREPIEDVEPEVYAINNQLTPEIKEKILQEFEYAAQVAKVKPIEGHPCIIGLNDKEEDVPDIRPNHGEDCDCTYCDLKTQKKFESILGAKGGT